MTRIKRSIDLPNLGHKAPIPLAARVGNIVCSSGISGKDAATGQLPAGVATQAANAFNTLRAVLAAAGATLDDVVRLTVTLRDDSVRDAVNMHWLSCFPDPADRPARHAVVHELQHGMVLQLELLAVVPGD